MKELNHLIKELKKDKNVESAYLFGSYAEGNAREDSDIDIAVITKKNTTDLQKGKIAGNSSEKIDLSIFWDMPLQIRFRILSEGKLLFTRNKANLMKIKLSTMREYQDFRPVIDFYIKRILGVSNV